MSERIGLPQMSRRRWLAVAAASLAAPAPAASGKPRVSVARCPSYEAAVTATLERMFEQLGGVDKLVAGKHVAIKIHMSNPLRDRMGYIPAWNTRWTHPEVIAAAVKLFSDAGAGRIRILESSSEDAHPLEENFLIGGCDPQKILSAGRNVEMENTSGLGYGNKYRRLEVPGGGLIYPGFDVNHSYAECDVFVSLAKLLEHPIAGLCLSLANLIGITPITIYGDAAGFEEPSEQPYGPRNRILFEGRRQPPLTAPQEKDSNSPRDPGYRVPRIIADLAAARPIHLAILDGIETQTASDTSTLPTDSKRQIRHIKPGVLVAGFNPVATDAIAASIMGFNPLAKRGEPPFENCDSQLELAEQAGLGPHNPSQIEVLGEPPEKVRFAFRQAG